MNSTEKFCLKWNDFETNIRNSFRSFREEQDYFNVTIACDDGYQIDAHKIVLSAGSQFFNEIFKKTKHPNPFIFLKGISRIDLDNIVDFLYKGEAYVAQEELNKFLETAQELQVKGLQSNQEDEDNQNQSDGNRFEESKSPLLDELNSFHNPQNIETIIEPLDKLTESTEVASISSDEMNTSLNTNDELDLQIEQMIEKNGRGGLWQCKVCGKTAKQKSNIKYHAETHIEGLSHTCQICSKPFSTRNSLQFHIQKVHSQQMFNCNICGETGLKKSTFWNHKKTCKPDQ